MRLRHVLAFALALLLYLQPATVAATQWSTQRYFFKYWPPNTGGAAASACGQAAIYDVALNWQLAFTRSWIQYQCNGSNLSVGPSLLGAKTGGWRDGTFCGYSATSWNNVWTAGWAISAYMCSNPAGSQTFYSQGKSIFYTGFDWSEWWVTSPVEHY